MNIDIDMKDVDINDKSLFIQLENPVNIVNFALIASLDCLHALMPILSYFLSCWPMIVLA